jgi:outer membrane immunogenic protein
MRQTVLAAAAAFAVASGAMTIQASAADLDFMAPPPPPFVPTWQGFYIGGHVGYGEADFDVEQRLDYFDDFNAALNDSYSFGSSLSPNGLLGGAQAGYNWQVNSLVFGIEGDVSFTDWDQSTSVFASGDVPGLGGVGGLDPLDYAFGTASAEINFLASLRGRLGFAMDSVMIYGTGGVAWADADARARMVVSDPGFPTETVFTGKESFDDIGFVVGGGASWMVIPQTFSVGVEGLYYFFDQDETLIADSIPYDTGDLDVRATASLDNAWVVRARADFHF